MRGAGGGAEASHHLTGWSGWEVPRPPEANEHCRTGVCSSVPSLPCLRPEPAARHPLKGSLTSPSPPESRARGAAMACRSCVVGFSSLSSCEVTPAGGPRPGTSGWGSCGTPGPGFSSRSLTGCGPAGTLPKITVNSNLLVPLDFKVDPAIQQQKNQEKEEMKVLNDKFASLIGKVSRCSGVGGSQNLRTFRPRQVAELCVSGASRPHP